MVKERTLVIFKPDVVQRQIVGELISKFERKGYKIIGMKMVVPTKKMVSEHYSDDEGYLSEVGLKSINSARERGESAPEGTPLEIGQRIRKWNVNYLCCGPVIAMVFEGAHVIESVRKLIGKTNPLLADVGTIRSDYTPDSYILADFQHRTTRTMLHASDSDESAKREIPIWFEKGDLYDYETAIEKILYNPDWSGN